MWNDTETRTSVEFTLLQRGVSYHKHNTSSHSLFTFGNKKRYLQVVADPLLECLEDTDFPRAVMVFSNELKVSQSNHIYRGRKGRAPGEAMAAKAFKELAGINWECCSCANGHNAKEIIDNA